jgi:hypothetical protein
VPGKYGLKSAKSIVRFTLSGERPRTLWETIQLDRSGHCSPTSEAHHADGFHRTGMSGLSAAMPASRLWEDFHDTFPHDLHIVDTLETAAAFGRRVRPTPGRDPALAMEIDFDPYRQGDFDALFRAWLPLTR